MLHHAFVSHHPLKIMEEFDAFQCYFTLLRDCRTYLDSSSSSSSNSSSSSFDIPLDAVDFNIRELQLNQQYLGYSPGIIAIAYYNLLTRIYPVQQLSVDSRVISRKKDVIRLGLVSEHFSNSSPALCFMVSLTYLSE